MPAAWSRPTWRSPVPDLIYITTRGAEYRAMAALLVQSLRGRGRFQGEILVLTKEIAELAAVDHLATIRQHTFTCHPMFDRVEALELVPAGFDTITCLDADILAMKPVDRLLQAEGHILYFEEPWQTIGDRPPGDIYTSRMTDAERADWARHKTINVGHFTLPGELLELFLALYRQVCEGPLVDGVDQAAFNAIIRSEAFPARPYRNYGIANCTQTDPKRWCAFDLCHWAGFPNKLDSMRERFAR
jgi:hypothetical protein